MCSKLDDRESTSEQAWKVIEEEKVWLSAAWGPGKPTSMRGEWLGKDGANVKVAGFVYIPNIKLSLAVHQ